MDEMLRCNSCQLQRPQRLGAVLDAAQREPVTIRRQKREVAVVLSPSDYRRLTTLDIAEFQRFCDRVSASAKAKGLAEETLSELLTRD